MEPQQNSTLRVVDPLVSYGPTQGISNNDSALHFQKEFHYTGYGQLYVLTREGLCYTLRSYGIGRSQTEPPGLTVYTARHVSLDVRIDIHRESMSSGNRAKDLYNNFVTRPHNHQGRDLYVSYSITEEQINNNGGSVYSPELDVVLSLADPVTNDIHHPYGCVSALSRPDSVAESRVPGAHMRLVFIDNERLMGQKWVRFGDYTLQITPVPSDSLRSGLYLVYQSMGEYSEVKQFWELKDVQANKTGFVLFNSRAEAMAWVEQKDHELTVTAMKRDTEELKISSGRRKIEDDEVAALRKELLDARKQLDELARLNTQNATDAAIAVRTEMSELILVERKAHEQRLEAEKKRYEEELRRLEEERKRSREEAERNRKDWYEERNYERKNLNEILKLIPAVASIVLSIVVLTKSKAK